MVNKITKRYDGWKGRLPLSDNSSHLPIVCLFVIRCLLLYTMYPVLCKHYTYQGILYTVNISVT